MFDPLAYWYLLPVGILIASIYSSTGISGANFWALVYILVLGLDPRLGFWLSLVSMLFGSLGGLAAHGARRTIRWRLVGACARFAVPAAAAGALAAVWVPGRLLLLTFGLFLLGYGAFLLHRLRSRATARSGIHPGWGLSGGFLTGLISVGTGELLLPRVLEHEQVDRPVVAAGTTLAVVFAASLTAMLLRLSPAFVDVLLAEQGRIASILLWEIPGVLLGSQLGPVVAHRLDRRTMTSYVAVLLVLVGALMLGRGWAG